MRMSLEEYNKLMINRGTPEKIMKNKPTRLEVLEDKVMKEPSATEKLLREQGYISPEAKKVEVYSYDVEDEPNNKNKYFNEKIEIDDYVFDSKKEANYYCDLKLLKKAKKIKDFELQPKFLLQEGYYKNGKKVREINYIADFRIINNDGTEEIVDVKGFKTNVFKMKKKMLEYKYPEITLIII